MRNCLPFVRVVRFAQNLLIPVLGGLLLLTGPSISGQATNPFPPSRSIPHGLTAWQKRQVAVSGPFTNAQLFWPKTNFASPFAARATARSGAQATIVSSGAHYRLWAVGSTNSSSARSGSGATGASGATSARGSGRVMEIGSGINYWDGEKWTASDASFDISPEGDAFVANRLCYKVRLQADNLNTLGAITVTTPDGKVLKSTPIAIALYDAASGQTMIVAGVTNCAGVLVNSNKVVYENAFNENGVQASVICTAERGSFAADIVMTSRLDPADYGFPAKTTRIQMITEYYDPPEPERIRTALRVEKDPAVRQKMASPDLMDETLGFGQLAFGRGRAYTMAMGATNAMPAVVAKEFTSAGARTFLVESVEFAAIQKALQSLPSAKPKGAFLKPKRSRKVQYARLPSAGAKSGRLAVLPARDKALVAPGLKQSGKEMASIARLNITGLCIDPGEYVGPGGFDAPTVFQGDTTYFISGPTYCNGPVTIEGGAVVKYPYWDGGNPPAFIQLNDSLTFKTAQYHPAIFTAGDDDSVGEYVPSSVWGNHTGDTTGKQYANPALVIMGSAPTLSNCRFSYATVGVDLENGLGITMADCQFTHCQEAFIAGAAEVDVQNSLFSDVNTLYTGYDFSYVTCQQSTFDRFGAPEAYCCGSGGGVDFVNCIFANSDFGFDEYGLVNGVGFSGDYNGFYSCPTFGDHIFSCDDFPFLTSGGGNYYLNNDINGGSRFRGVGTTAIDSTLLNSLKTRTTQPPIDFPTYMEMAGDLTLFPQIARYVSGAPDLGYYYDALDYTVAGMLVEGGSVTVLPGTAVGMRNDYIPEIDDYTYFGVDIWQGSLWSSHGMPAKPITFTDVQQVQESVPVAAEISFQLDYAPNAENLPPPTVDFRFCNFYLGSFQVLVPAGPRLDFPSYHFAGGVLGFGIGPTTDSAAFVNLKDCNIFGGQIEFGKIPGPGWVVAPAAINWFNNVFDRVGISIDPDGPDFGDPTPYIDLGFQAYNNTFHGGPWFHLEPIAPSDGSHWTLKDNLFDGVDFVQDEQGQPLDYDYNAYWALGQDELGFLSGWYPWNVNNRAQLQPTTFSGDLNGGNERSLSVTPPYQTGPLGDYYLDTGSELYNSGERGSRLVTDAGLYHYTTRVDQTKDGDQSGNVIIGHHYVATANSSTTQPKDTDNDGIADYVENASGDGVFANHVGIETDWQNAYTDTDPDTGNPIADWLNVIYDDADLDGDGMVGRIEKALATVRGISPQPLVPDNPLNLTQVITGDEPQIITWKVPIDYSLLTAVGGLNLNINGIDASLEGLTPAADGKCLLTWNTAFDPPGIHYLQAHIIVNGAATDFGSTPSVDSGGGAMIAFDSGHVLQFFEDGSVFDSSGAYLDAQLPEQNATYSIDLYDASTTPQTLIRTIGPKSTSTGIIQEDWSVTYADDVTPFAGDAVDAVFNVTLSASGKSGSGRKPMRRPPCPSGSNCALSEFGLNFNFLYMYTPKKSSPTTSDFARGGLVWIGMQAVVDVLMQPANGWPVYQSYFDQFTCYPCTTFPGYVTSRGMITGTLFPVMGGARQFYCYSHGSGNWLGSVDGQTYMTASEVGTLLGNIYQPKGGLTTYNPYRFVFLDGCSTASQSDWRRAFGIYPLSAPNQAARNKVGPQAYVGWATSYSGYLNGGTGNSAADLDVASAYTTTLLEFYLDFMTGSTVRQCIDHASQSRPNIAPLPVPSNKYVTFYGNSSSLAGHPYSWQVSGGITTSKIYVVGHSGLKVNQLGYDPSDDGKYAAPSNTE